MFFFYWAFARNGAPNGFRIATIKALNTKEHVNFATKLTIISMVNQILETILLLIPELKT